MAARKLFISCTYSPIYGVLIDLLVRKSRKVFSDASAFWTAVAKRRATPLSICNHTEELACAERREDHAAKAGFSIKA
jgi:hypothetical protein